MRDAIISHNAADEGIKITFFYILLTRFFAIYF